MPNRLQTLRFKAYQKQNGNCYYCNMPMWEENPNDLAIRYQVSTSRIKPLKSTAEHLQARQDGGKETTGNIVAACHYCNSHRHKSKTPKDPVSYKAKVQKRMLKQGWTASLIPNMVLLG